MTDIELQKYREELDQWSGFTGILPTSTFIKLIHRHEKLIALFTGNQFGKNVTIMKHYVVRWLGKHFVEAKNLRPETVHRTYRFCAEKKPNDTEGGDTNTIYPVLKKMWPKKLIRKDITQRNSVMTLIEPYSGLDFFVEFMGYSQEIQVSAGQQRASVYLDENCKREFYNEQIPRLFTSDGDIIIGMTPALGQVTWQFEDIYEKARTIIRTPLVISRLKEKFGKDYKEEEVRCNDNDICVFMAASDDNPAYDILVKNKNEKELELTKQGKHPIFKTVEEFKPITKAGYIKGKIDAYDEETEDIRRYGIFRQVSGRVFKDFDQVHEINESRYFPDGIPHQWLFGRATDYHQSTPWHTTFIAISPQDEAFVWQESVMSPDKFVTLQMARDIAGKGKDYKFTYNKIDPLAAMVQSNTGVSTIDDLNRIFSELKRDNIGTGGYWSSWDSKSTRGREEVKKRLKNSRLCGTPFNNKQMVDGRLQWLPTMWIFSDCRVTIDSLKNWRYDEWANRSALETKDPKETPMQKNSHICTAIECLFKEQGFKGRPEIHNIQPIRKTVMQYGRR